MNYHIIIIAAGICVSGVLAWKFRNRTGVWTRILAIFGVGVGITSVVLIFLAGLIVMPAPGPYFNANKMEDEGLRLPGNDIVVRVTFSSSSQHIFSTEDSAVFTVPYQGTYVVSIFFVRSPPLEDRDKNGGGNCYVRILHGDGGVAKEIALAAAYRSGQGASTSASITSPVFLNRNERIWCEASSDEAAILKDIQFSAVAVSAFQIPLTFALRRD